MSSSQYIPYATVAFICSFALLHFSSNIRQYAPNTYANRFFRASIVSSAVCSMMEFCFVFHESGIITNLFFCYLTEIIYSFASLSAGFFWFMSSEIEQNAKTVSTTERQIICAIPIAAMAILDITTPLHHLLFYFTPDGHYERGIFSTLFVIITAIYIVKSGLFALIKANKSKYYLKRKQYRTFFYYALAILISQILQILFGSVLPFRIVGAAFVFFLVQENTLKQNIITDLLTDTNNRTAMEKYLKTNFENSGGNFAFVMIDLDNFKQINDTYGHTTGDTTLHLIADAFKKSIPPSFFFGRYGGDEFVIIGNTDSSDQIDKIICNVTNNIAELCTEKGYSFTPEFSYGISYKAENIKTIPDLINHADETMYENKRRRKSLMA